MVQWYGNLKQKLEIENQVLQQNHSTVNQRNLGIVKLILMGGMAIFSASLISTYFHPLSNLGYLNMRWAYLLLIMAMALLYIGVCRLPLKNGIYWVYGIYSVGVVYCVITSGVVSSQYVSVTILALLFQIPILYLDKTLRIDTFVVVCAGVYLVGIFPLKQPALFVDEVMNTCTFAAISLILGTFTRESQIENLSMRSTLHQYAYTDQLTKLSNRRKLFEDFSTAKLSSEGKEITGVAMMDIDFFKRFNDTYGHQAGDACLFRVSECFLSFQQNRPLQFYRYGGEEFVMVSYGYSGEELFQLVTELRCSVQALQIPHSTAPLAYVTISAGISDLSTCKDGEYQVLLSQADSALYRAKEAGRNCVIAYDNTATSPLVGCGFDFGTP